MFEPCLLHWSHLYGLGSFVHIQVPECPELFVRLVAIVTFDTGVGSFVRSQVPRTIECVVILVTAVRVLTSVISFIKKPSAWIDGMICYIGRKCKVSPQCEFVCA